MLMKLFIYLEKNLKTLKLSIANVIELSIANGILTSFGLIVLTIKTEDMPKSKHQISNFNVYVKDPNTTHNKL